MKEAILDLIRRTGRIVFTMEEIDFLCNNICGNNTSINLDTSNCIWYFMDDSDDDDNIGRELKDSILIKLLLEL